MNLSAGTAMTQVKKLDSGGRHEIEQLNKERSHTSRKSLPDFPPSDITSLLKYSNEGEEHSILR